MNAAASGDHADRPQLRSAVEVVQGWIDRRQRAMFARLHSCGQSPAQLHVLGLLRDHGPITVTQLAARLGIAPPSASTIAERMVEAGLVHRERGLVDRRLVSLSLTPAGSEALARASGGRRDTIERVLGQLTDHELVDVVRLAGRLDEAMRVIEGRADPDVIPG